MKSANHKFIKIDNSTWRYSMEGYALNRLLLDNALTIEFLHEELRISLRIETGFKLYVTDVEYLISPEYYTGIKYFHELINHEIKDFLIGEDGSVTVLFLDSSLKILVEPHQEFEAWELFDTNGILCVSLPSGGLATWFD